MKPKDWRISEGLTQEQLADRLNVTVVTVARYEAEKRMPDAGVKQRYFLLSGGKVEPNDWYDLPAWRAKLSALFDRLCQRAA